MATGRSKTRSTASISPTARRPSRGTRAASATDPLPSPPRARRDQPDLAASCATSPVDHIALAAGAGYTNHMKLGEALRKWFSHGPSRAEQRLLHRCHGDAEQTERLIRHELA